MLPKAPGVACYACMQGLEVLRIGLCRVLPFACMSLVYIWRCFLRDVSHGMQWMQVPMHPSTLPYMGVEMDGQVYVMPYLPFGVASACREYTQVMRSVYDPMRAIGLRLVSYIDDALGKASSKSAAKYDVVTLCMLLTALGFFFSMAKCMMSPAQIAYFLGMVIDTILTECRVPREKLEYFKEQVEISVVVNVAFTCEGGIFVGQRVVPVSCWAECVCVRRVHVQ